MESSTHPLTVPSHWKPIPLIVCNGLALALLFSFFAPYCRPFWDGIDVWIFSHLNQPMSYNGALRNFWAIANHKGADWFEDLCILGFYIAGVCSKKKEERMRTGLGLFFSLLLTALTILMINRFLCRDLLRLRRLSPSLVLYDTIHLSDFLCWIQVKTNSGKSFPADHATTALMFAFSYAYLIRGKWGILALSYGALLCLPRIAVGAHWPSDALVGSGSIMLISLSWGFYTPIKDLFIHLLEKKWTSLKKILA